MPHKKVLLWVLVTALCCGLGGAAGYLPLRAVPPISQQLPENYSHLTVQVISPMRESHWALNSFVPIVVQAQAAEPIKIVELFINGTPLKAQPGMGDSFSSIWSWQPGVAGDFVLMARAIGKSGLASVSAPITIHATAAGYTVSPVSVQTGDTLQSIAAKNNIPLDEMQQSNPNVGLDTQLQGGQHVFVPNAPGPVTNQEIIAPLPAGSQLQLGESQSGGSEPPNESPSIQKPEMIGPSTNLWDDVKFLWGFDPPVSTGGQSSPKYPPSTPLLFGDFKGCDVSLEIPMTGYEDEDPKSGWMGWEEDGFFIYRSRDGGASERIRTLPAVHKLDSSNSKVQFTDAGQYGTLTYYVSAFNALGEVASKPLTFALNPGTCPAPNAAGDSGIRLDPGGDLVLPFHMDTAYLYLQINGSSAVRVPEGNRMFLPGSGVRLNLYDYLGTISDSVQTPDLKLHMEVWGWQGGNLVFAGTFDTELHRTVLSICSLPGEGACSSGGGSWVATLTLPHDTAVKDLVYEMRWQVTNLTAADNLLLTVSENPLPLSSGSQGLLYHASLNKWVVNGKYLNTKGNEGIFPLELGDILYPETTPDPIGWDLTPSKLTEYRSEGFVNRPAGQPFTVYAHILANLGMNGYEHESNLVTILYDTSAPPVNMPPLASPYPSLYTVDILEEQFKPASHYNQNTYDTDMWGCVVIDEDPTGQYAVGQVVCPGKDASYAYYHQDDCGDTVLSLCLLEGLGNAMGFLYDEFKLGYDSYKDIIAQGLAAIIPGCSDSPKCQGVLHTAVDYAAAYVTGLPPDLPSSDELIGDSIAETIVTLAEQGEMEYTGLDESFLGTLCEQAADCKEKISGAIQQQLKQAKSIASQPACIDTYQAYFHGQAPACLDPSIVVHPAPGSIESPAVALVRVTRNNTPVPASETGKNNNSVFVTVNADSAGSPSTHADPFLKPGQIGLPPLSPGESITVPVVLPSLWKETPDFSGGVAHINAVEKCQSPGSTWDWVPCKDGGSDAADVTLP